MSAVPINGAIYMCDLHVCTYSSKGLITYRSTSLNSVQISNPMISYVAILVPYELFMIPGGTCIYVKGPLSDGLRCYRRLGGEWSSVLNCS